MDSGSRRSRPYQALPVPLPLPQDLRSMRMTSTASLCGRDRDCEAEGMGAAGSSRRRLAPAGGVERDEVGGVVGVESRVVDGRAGVAPSAGGMRDGLVGPNANLEGDAPGDMEEKCRRICKTLKEDCKVWRD